nr:MAG TPA: nucleoid-associated protein [Caudoviricetes sp.]
MRDIILAFDRFGDQALLLGRVGENRATRVLIDLKSILSQYPDAIASITVKPPGRAEYPATVKQEGGILTWEITSADIGDKAGSGQAQITIQDADGTIIKTAIACTRIGESLGDATAPAPDPVETWLDKATGTLADVERAGNAAQAVADEVQRRLDNGDFVGPQGPQGDRGETGPIGPQGLKGEKGDKGDRGEKGDTGPKGETGAKGDAFTFGDFTLGQLESLRGPKGDTGATGAQGPQGAKGEPGKDAVIDATLTQEGEAADAAATGKRLAEIEKAVSEKADKARQNILIGSETGNPVSVSDAFSAPLCGLTVYGRSTQDGTPSPDNPVPIVSAGNGGTILVKVGDGADGQQTITLQTPNGLPGIHVTSGGNYTDPQGQQWICDEIDLTRGVRVQNTRMVDVSTLRISGNVKMQITKRLSYILKENAQSYKINAICNILPYLTSFDRDVIHFYTNKGNIFAFIPVDSELPLEGECFVLYALDAPVETPLTDAEIAAYKALTTYAPNTVVQASDGAGLKLDYQRDVNIVIKNLEDAIASMTTT